MSFLEQTLNEPVSAPTKVITIQNGVQLSSLETGIVKVSPAVQGSYRIVISCGIHGNETAPMELVDKLVSEIESGELVVKNELLFVIGNPQAAKSATRFVEENLNRLFSGKWKASLAKESDRAELIEQVTRKFFTGGDESRLHYDLHTAIRGSKFEKFAVCPFLHDRAYSKGQISFLERCGIDAVLLSNKPAGTYSYFTSNEFNANSFTVELGKVRPFGENNLADFELTLQGLRALIAGIENFELEPKKIQAFSVVEEVIKRSESLKLHFPEDAENFTVFSKGSLLVTDQSYEYRTTRDAERFVFPITDVPIGQRALLVVAPTTV